MDGRRSGLHGQLDRPGGLTGDGGEPRLTDQDRRSTCGLEYRQILPGVIDPAELELGIKTDRERSGRARNGSEDAVGCRQRLVEVVQGDERRGLRELGFGVSGFDRERLAGGVERALVVAEVIAETTAALVEHRKVGRREVVVRVGGEVLRPCRDRVVDLFEADVRRAARIERRGVGRCGPTGSHHDWCRRSKRSGGRPQL